MLCRTSFARTETQHLLSLLFTKQRKQTTKKQSNISLKEAAKSGSINAIFTTYFNISTPIIRQDKRQVGKQSIKPRKAAQVLIVIAYES